MNEILIILILIAANGFFAMSEFAIVSARQIRLEQRSAHGNLGARQALELTRDPTKFLSTIQIGITLIGLLTGVFGGAQVADLLGGLLDQTILGVYGHPVAYFIVIIVITYLTLVFGELLPKTLALKNAEGVAAFVSRPMKWIAVLATPVVKILSLSTDLLAKLFGISGHKEPAVTEEEIKSIIAMGKKHGIVSAKEAEFIARVFQAADSHVREIMTPRTAIVWIDRRMTVGQFLEFNARQSYSHFPVCDGALDMVQGMLAVKDVLRAVGNDQVTEQDLVMKVSQSAYYVPETKDILDLMEEMRQNGKSIALLVDEFGNTSGLVNYKQLIGELVGQVRQEGSQEPIRTLGNGVTQINGSLRITEANSRLALGLPESDDYDTVAGFVLKELGHIARKGDQVKLGNLSLEVSEVFGQRIGWVSLIRSNKP
jgi:putative hemolysin